nr:hypothetical protein [Sulfitobacter sp. M22]
MGMESVVNIIYSVSPRHTTEYFVQRTRDAASLKPYRLCFKDVGGLLTPSRLRELLPKVLQAAGDIPVEFYNHCNNGLGTFNAHEAVDLGIRHIHSAVPPLTDGSSQPSVLDILRNLRARGHDVALDEAPLSEVSEYLTRIAQREGLAIGQPRAYDETLYAHQIPGGMISNLEYQLEKVGMKGRMDLIREEAAKVRAELGYPIMVSPLSQFDRNALQAGDGRDHPVRARALGPRGAEAHGPERARPDPRPAPGARDRRDGNAPARSGRGASHAGGGPDGRRADHTRLRGRNCGAVSPPPASGAGGACWPVPASGTDRRARLPGCAA